MKGLEPKRERGEFTREREAKNSKRNGYPPLPLSYIKGTKIHDDIMFIN